MHPYILRASAKGASMYSDAFRITPETKVYFITTIPDQQDTRNQAHTATKSIYENPNHPTLDKHGEATCSD